MISLVVGGVIGVGTIVYLTRTAGTEKPTEETNNLNPDEASTKEKENEVVLSDEQKAALDKLRQQRYNEAKMRREHALGGLSAKDRELFEEFVSEVNDKSKKQNNNSSDSLWLEILVLFSGLLFVYALVVLSSDTFYSPLDILRILSRFFDSNKNPFQSDTQPSSPFAESIQTPTNPTQDL